MADDCRRRLPPLAAESGEDHISGLPDELLHVILLRLGSVPAAARTSVLSRRWRRIWANLPELILSQEDEGPESEAATSFPNTVDAVLAAYAARTLEHLSIRTRYDVPAHRVAPWLRFASERVTGGISFRLLGREEAELELPSCSTATTIALYLPFSWMLRPTGAFAVLTCLQIYSASMDGRELSDLVSTQCPRLKKLDLRVTLAAVFDLSLHSDSLHSLHFFAPDARRVEVIAPRLEDLSIWTLADDEADDEIRVSAPKLANVEWFGPSYDACRYQFTHVSRRLRLLKIQLKAKVTPLLKQFNEVDELQLTGTIGHGTEGYKTFMNFINQLSKCETLRISLQLDKHGLVPAVLHLLRCCNSIKKLSMRLSGHYVFHPSRYYCQLDCPCTRAESCNIDNIALFSLEEVEIEHFLGSLSEMEFLEQLSRCNAPILKKLSIIVLDSPLLNKKFCFKNILTKEVREKVRCLCRPNLKVEFYRESIIKGGPPVRVRLD